MRDCVAPGCRQNSSNLREDGLCFAHGKEADGLMELREHKRERMPPAWRSGSARGMPRLTVGPRPGDWLERHIARARAKN